MYFKIVNVLLTGESKIKHRPMKLLIGINTTLAVLCILFGLLPQIQLYILTKVL
jgi:hypothetical protein